MDLVGRKIVLTGTTLTDLSAPKLLQVDPIESAGSLLLIDPTHPMGPWATGVPAHDTTVRNLVRTLGAQATGLTEGQMDLTVRAGANITSGKTVMERTSKGGYHNISSRSGAVAQGDVVLDMSAELISYFLHNPTHDIYGSLWVYTTRRAVNQTHVMLGVVGQQQTNSMALVLGPHANEATEWIARPGFGAELGSHVVPTGSGVGPKYISHGSPGWGSSNGIPDLGKAAPSGPVAVGGIAFGATPASLGIGLSGNRLSLHLSPLGPNANVASSMILYRAYLEDLTVSGRTYAEVDAIDYALYTQQVLTAGGRYYGDTFTNPSTLP